MSKLLTILIAIILLASCRPVKIVQTVTKDSIITKDTVIYKTVKDYLPGDTVEVWQAIPCPDAKVDTQVSKGSAHLHVTVSKGILKARCNSDSLLHVIDSIQALRVKESYHRETIAVPVDKPVPYIPKWVWWFITIALLHAGIIYRHDLIKIFTRL